MTYVLLRSSAFVREAREIIKKYPQIAQNPIRIKGLKDSQDVRINFFPKSCPLVNPV